MFIVSGRRSCSTSVSTMFARCSMSCNVFKPQCQVHDIARLGPFFRRCHDFATAGLRPDLNVTSHLACRLGGPLLNQVQETSQRNKMKLRSGAACLGLAAASLLAAQNADAAEIAQVCWRVHC